ncbi:hypothetical protein [Leptospirillum ferriphilum]|uniref:Uncharacterized protein n=1 Tax=Leptospirillum ferriphilum (strain ML-04) TaxID=1048260 RepID=J9ZAN3_LEPFM|nr:hypothetical protein [Leptospirillum ferriphilum]AFS52948.1 hypothetical protein LFML04_0713 [Leptospirillum ferriphilum ML-04]OOH80759.1 hypothetical protein BOX30_05310 [Leptospirillum ferriphilum]
MPSCLTCLKFRSDFCEEWDQKVPLEYRETGCEKASPETDPQSFREAFGKVSTMEELLTLTERWNAGNVSDDLWELFQAAHLRLVNSGQKPLFHFIRMKLVYGWCLDHVPFFQGSAKRIRVDAVAEACGITEDQAQECLEQLYKEGTLKMEKTRKKESLFWLEVKYDRP